MAKYKIGVGYAGIALEWHTLEAKNTVEARTLAIKKYLHPDLGYDHIQVSRIQKEVK